MIKQYDLLLKQENSKAPVVLSANDAYLLYGALMEKVGTDTAERLHSQETAVVSQYLIPLCDGQKVKWAVNLLCKEQFPEIAVVMEDSNSFNITSKGCSLKVEERGSIVVNNIGELMDIPGEDQDCSRFHLRFVSPTSFHVNGEYQFFPTVRHILGSLSQRWSSAFPQNAIDDDDAFAALEKGVRITGYNLKSVYYPLKGNSIAAFTGSVTISARLAPPMLQLLRGMLSFASFSGVGIKTTLGMGGVAVKESPKPSSVY
ncbi:MAG: CRISPR system precrRNA processing endoribonuclease RAMP protein Cas6 [Synergistaceae bacterium]|nr:CRISPR system precrRNA processing endoribonuclease RAMP protein Cas6 [Synergistaceae bacterium]